MSDTLTTEHTMPSDQKIDYIEFPANDFDAIEAFYSKTFGWTFTDYGPEYRAFSDERLDGGFYKSELRSARADGAALVVLFADDLEVTQARVSTNGGTICQEIFSFPGGRRFHFQDPHGNELAVWSDK
jgi:predicted enzyme related to lactoylglutathione lyase